MFKHIAVATDLSRHAGLLYAHATRFAALGAERLTLVFVDERDSLGLSMDKTVEDYLDQLTALFREQLTKDAQALDLPGVTVASEQRVGSPVYRALLDFAENPANAVDLLIAGQSGEAPLLLGSTTTRLVRHAPCPMLVVDPAGYETTPECVDVRRIYFPTDFSDRADTALPLAVDLARRMGADLILVHVLPPLLPYAASAAHDMEPETTQVLAERLRTDAEQRLRALVTANREVRFETVVERAEHVAEALDRLADEETDLFVVPSHGRGAISQMLLGSTTEKLLRRTTRPVLVMRQQVLPQRHRAGVPGLARLDTGECT